VATQHAIDVLSSSIEVSP